MVQIRNILEIPDSEFEFTFSRSSGPGGQHVNKVSSRVTLWFDIEKSGYLSEAQKERLKQRLSGRINRDGKLHVSSQDSRSQSANREAVLQRFALIVGEALEEERSRKATRIPRTSRERRLLAKKRRSRLKKERGKILTDGD